MMGLICDIVRVEIFFILFIGYRGYLYVIFVFVFSKSRLIVYLLSGIWIVGMYYLYVYIF